MKLNLKRWHFYKWWKSCENRKVMLNKFIYAFFFYFTNKIPLLGKWKKKKVHIDHPLLTSQPQKRIIHPFWPLASQNLSPNSQSLLTQNSASITFFSHSLSSVHKILEKCTHKNKNFFIKAMNLLPLEKKSQRQVYNNAFMTAQDLMIFIFPLSRSNPFFNKWLKMRFFLLIYRLANGYYVTER